MRACGQPWTKWVSKSAKYVCGLTAFSLQVSTRDAMCAQFLPPSLLPANRAFFLDSLIGRMARSTLLLSSSMRCKRCGVAILPGWVLGVVGLLEAGSFELTLCLTLTMTRGLGIGG